MNKRFPGSLKQPVSTRLANLHNNRRLEQLGKVVAAHTPPNTDQQPVIFFRASTGLLRLSQNTAFGLLAGWGLQLAGTPVIHFVCQAGMSRCVQGTDRDHPESPPPCTACMRHARYVFAHSQVHAFGYTPDPDLNAALQGLSVDELASFTFPAPSPTLRTPIPLGALVIPALRWVLRRHHLDDDQPTRFLLREYILSAFSVVVKFDALLKVSNPQAVVVFNGIFYPEAAARWVAQQYGLRVITYEVAMRPFTAFFTDGQATAYPIQIPDDFQLSPEQNNRLDAYLNQRFQGNFSMAGIRFWPEMRDLDESFLQHAAGFKQIVPVFTNVIFDTSQVHANVVFPEMFAWLDAVLAIAQAHSETLFVIRAHPDEMRAGKRSRESVRQWVEDNHVTQLPNVIYIDAEEYLSSYRLIQRSKFVLVYNSSIGLEAALMGSAVLAGGKARYTQIPTVFFPPSPQAFNEQVEEFLAAERIEVPPEFERNARRFLYFQLYKTSLSFAEYLEPHPMAGFVRLRDFDWKQLLLAQSTTMRLLLDGIVHGQPFLISNDTGDW
jgi:hypothetical protein